MNFAGGFVQLEDAPEVSYGLDALLAHVDWDSVTEVLHSNVYGPLQTAGRNVGRNCLGRAKCILQIFGFLL